MRLARANFLRFDGHVEVLDELGNSSHGGYLRPSGKGPGRLLTRRGRGNASSEGW